MILRRFLFLILTGIIFLSCTTGVSEKEAAEAYYNLGNTYFDLGEYSKAVRAYQRALQLDSSFSMASYNLARLYLETNDIDQSITVLNEILMEDSDNTIILNTLGYAYTLQERNQEALDIFLSILERSPYDSNALYNSAVLYWKLENREKALTQFQELYRNNPEDSDVLYNLGILEIELERPDGGIRYLEEYRKQEPNDTDALTALGTLYEEEKYFDRALEIYNILTEKEGIPRDIYFRKARILLTAIGDGEAGLKALEEAYVSGFEDKGQYQALFEDPDLVNKEQVRIFLEEKGLLLLGEKEDDLLGE